MYDPSMHTSPLFRYWVHPAQAVHPPEEQRWILWFLGNGEVYEMMMPDFESMHHQHSA